jgi:hypothetical protein
MYLRVNALPDRIAAALYGASAAEAAAETATGVRQLIELAAELASAPALDDDVLRTRGLAAAPPTGLAGLLLRAVPVGLLTPLDRPRLRRDAHRCAIIGGADAGTAMVAVATAVLAADLCRFDLDTALVRLRQTLLEEAPAALLQRLVPLPSQTGGYATGDPGDALQHAITALAAGRGVPQVIEAALSIAGEVAAAAALSGALAGARDGLMGIDDEWLAAVPARARIADVAKAMAEHAVRLLPGDEGDTQPRA